LQHENSTDVFLDIRVEINKRRIDLATSIKPSGYAFLVAVWSSSDFALGTVQGYASVEVHKKCDRITHALAMLKQIVHSNRITLPAVPSSAVIWVRRREQPRRGSAGSLGEATVVEGGQC